MDEKAANPPAISVRHMREEEQKAVKSLAGRAFPPLGGIFFSPSQHTLVAERDVREARRDFGEGGEG